MEEQGNGQSLRELLGAFTREFQDLVRMEAELAVKELSSKGEQARRGLFTVAGGGTAACAGLIIVLAAISIGLGILLSLLLPIWICAWLAPLIVGGTTMAFGAAAALDGAKSLKPSSFVPRETVRSLKEDAQWLGRGLR